MCLTTDGLELSLDLLVMSWFKHDYELMQKQSIRLDHFWIWVQYPVWYCVYYQ